MSAPNLKNRSVRTLAWLGDAEFEREVRTRVAMRGDYPTERLNAVKAHVVRSETQARLLAAIEDRLDDDERRVVRRGRNTAPPNSPRNRRNTRAYRAATALEALVALWELGGGPGRRRFDRLLAPLVESAIDDALERTRKRRPQ